MQKSTQKMKNNRKFIIRSRKNVDDFWLEIWRSERYVHLVHLVKSFPTSLYLQKSASIQPRTSPSKFGAKFNSLFTSLLYPAEEGPCPAPEHPNLGPGVTLDLHVTELGHHARPQVRALARVVIPAGEVLELQRRRERQIQAAVVHSGDHRLNSPAVRFSAV